MSFPAAGPISELSAFSCPSWPQSVSFCRVSLESSWRPHPTSHQQNYGEFRPGNFHQNDGGFLTQNILLLWLRALSLRELKGAEDSDGHNGLECGAGAIIAWHHPAAGENPCHRFSWATAAGGCQESDAPALNFLDLHAVVPR